MPTPTFWLERTGRARVFAFYVGGECPRPRDGTKLHEVRLDLGEDAIDGPRVSPNWNRPHRGLRCDSCGGTFDGRLDVVGHRHQFRRGDTGEMVDADDAKLQPGAMYDAAWLGRYPEWTGPDGRSLHVVLPNRRHWCVDSRASNCDSPCAHCGRPYNAHFSGRCDPAPENPNADDDARRYADARPHKCWIRHGDPSREPVTVDKRGVTCGAGAGSIQAGDYHGFLQNGVLTP